jgi:hypothetical protein
MVKVSRLHAQHLSTATIYPLCTTEVLLLHLHSLSLSFFFVQGFRRETLYQHPPLIYLARWEVSWRRFLRTAQVRLEQALMYHIRCRYEWPKGFNGNQF